MNRLKAIYTDNQVGRYSQFSAIGGRMKEVACKTDKQIKKILAAQGFVHAVIVGVSTYIKKSFKNLPQCKNDALAIYDCFKNMPQLNADKKHLHLLMDATKSNIMLELEDLVKNAEGNDRIVFFFSGHGEKIEDKFYLVPSDVWNCEKIDALIDFDEIKDLLSSSSAKQKVILLDACYSGSNTTTVKKKANLITKSFLETALKTASGTTIISSSSDSQSSSTKSPDGNLSLFSYYLIKALKGDAEAQDESLLTSASLFKYLSPNVITFSKSCGNIQTPIINEVASTSCFLFGDYSKILSTTSPGLASNINGITFYETEELYIKEMLPPNGYDSSEFDNITQVVEYYLPKHFENKLGEFRAELHEVLEVDWDILELDSLSVSFDDGHIDISFSDEDEMSATVKKEIHFGKSWFQSPNVILSVLDHIDIEPAHIMLHLNAEIELNSFAKDLGSHGWKIRSFTKDKIIAEQNTRIVTIKRRALKFVGFLPEEILNISDSGSDSYVIETVYSLVDNNISEIVPKLVLLKGH